MFKFYRSGIGMGLMLALLLLITPIYTQAQLSDDERENIELVASAYQKLTSQQSYHIEGEMVTDQTLFMLVLGQPVDMNITGSMAIDSQVQLQNDGDVDVMSSLVSGKFDVEAGDGVTALLNGTSLMVVEQEMRLVDEILYMREVSTLAGLPIGENSDWRVIEGKNLTLMREIVQQQFGLSEDTFTINNPAISPGISALSYFYPINENSVSALEELPEESLDGQAMRVFLVTFDYAGMMTEAQQNFVERLTREIQGSGMMPFDFTIMMQNMTDGTGMALQQTVWIGREDGLPHRIQTHQVMDMDLQVEVRGENVNITIDQDATVLIDVLNINEPVEVEAPDMP